MAVMTFHAPHPFTTLRRKIRQAATQYRHNNDNSRSLFHPDSGFVDAYDIRGVELALAEYAQTLDSEYHEEVKEVDIQEHLLHEAEMLSQGHPSQDVRAFSRDVMEFIQQIPKETEPGRPVASLFATEDT